MVVNKGRIISNVALSQPAKILIFPVSALWQPPETGQSTAFPPLLMTSAPKRFTSASSVVDISNQVFPSVTNGSIVCITTLEAAGLGKHVITRSQTFIKCAGFSPIFAPFFANSAVSWLFKS